MVISKLLNINIQPLLFCFLKLKLPIDLFTPHTDESLEAEKLGFFHVLHMVVYFSVK